jgi:phosphoribosylformimino-5-aminoimidazole carboxamide ribotide isomerase
MEIIPVIDLLGARVVHAKKGCRSAYRPIHSPLCARSEPRAVIDALLSLNPFKTLYIADLDALMQRGQNRHLIEDLRHAYPDITFWIDEGLPRHSRFSPQEHRAINVIGSESLGRETLPLLGDKRHERILSLDFFDHGLLGPSDLLEDPGLWPEKVIVMSLARVGSFEGPDFGTLLRLSQRWPEKCFIAAGGIRDQQDLERLERMGIEAALVATALHAGTLGAAALKRCGKGWPERTSMERSNAGRQTPARGEG